MGESFSLAAVCPGMNAKTTVTTGWTAGVASNVFEGSANEDGETEHLAFYVLVENTDGERFVSKKTFTTENMACWAAKDAAERFLDKVQAALHTGADPRTSTKWAPARKLYTQRGWDAEALDDERRALEADGFYADAARVEAKVMSLAYTFES